MLERWPKWVREIIKGKRPLYIPIRVCGDIHRALMRASDGDWYTSTELRERMGSAKEVQLACMLGLLESDKSPFEKGKKFRITKLGLNALEELNNALIRCCAWYHPKMWKHSEWLYEECLKLGIDYKSVLCKRKRCFRSFELIRVEINEDWARHVRQYKW